MANGNDRRTKIRRQHVEVTYRDGQRFVHDICDLAIPSPDGRYFVVRDLTMFTEAVGKKGESSDYFYPTDLIGKIIVTSKQFWVLPDGSRGEIVLDNEAETTQIIT